MNVLLTCAGRRNYLMQFFREALGGRGTVFAADSCPVAAAMIEADRGLFVPPVSQPRYFDILYGAAVANQVRLIISLNDLELPGLAREKARFLAAGIIPVVSDPSVIDLCFDKGRTMEFLTEIGVQTPSVYLTLAEAHAALEQGTLTFPLVVKPRWGTGSIGVEIAQNRRQLDLIHELSRSHLSRTILGEVSACDHQRCLVIQARLSGQEYGLDIVNDLEGEYITTFVKRKHAMRAGETDQAETVDIPELRAVGEQIGRKLSHVGVLDCDAFMTEHGPVILDLNPRFGGGYPFSHAAGANIPAALIAWANGESADPAWFKFKYGVVSSKCDRLVTKWPDSALDAKS